MRRVNEVVSSKIGDYLTNFVTWNGVMYNVLQNDLEGGGVVDDTAALQTLVNEAIAEGRKAIFLPYGKNGQYRVTDLTNADKVVFFGDNATFVGGFNKRIEQIGASTPTIQASTLLADAISQQIVPLNGLLAAKRSITETSTLKIAYWGDSITYGYNLNDPNNKYAARFENRLKEVLPSVSITSQNFSLGSRTVQMAASSTYLALSSEPPDPTQGFYAPWATVGKSWRDNVRDFQPDLVVVAFGMNDAYVNTVKADEIFSASLDSLVQYSKTWTKQPSIVLVPVFLPTQNAALTPERQDVVFSVARATREYGQLNGYPVADANRIYNILRNGIDDVARSNITEVGFVNFPSGWIGDTNSFILSGAILTPKPGVVGKFVYRNRNFYNGFIQFDVIPSVASYSGEAWVNFRNSTLGTMTLLVRGGTGTTGNVQLFANTTSLAQANNLTIPLNVATTIRIESYGSNHKVYVNGVKVIDVTGIYVLHDGTVGLGGDGTVPTYSNLQIGYDDPLGAKRPFRTTPIFSESELIGDYNSTINDGNGINHPTGAGHYLFYYVAFKGVIQELARLEEKGLYLPNRIPAADWAVPGTGWTTTTRTGKTIYFKILNGAYRKSRGIALRNLSSYAYLGLSDKAIDAGTLIDLEDGKFAYFNVSGSDMIFISNTGAPTFDSELYRFLRQP
ncbi:SGNH/GDSL hydrolase family protein [Cohnella nanjingensis]|nr:SGNH/GDSL hydrolase family protein [Cohnella nanjingensis]